MAIKISAGNELKVNAVTRNNAETEQNSGEMIAAIAMAMHEFLGNVHDEENTVITINRVRRRYSPWSSKIYTLRETPRKK